MNMNMNIMSQVSKSSTQSNHEGSTSDKPGKDKKKPGKDRSCSAVLYSNMPSLTSLPPKEGGKSKKKKASSMDSSDDSDSESEDEVRGWRKQVESEVLDDGVTGWAAVSPEDELMIRAGLAGLGVVADGVRTAEKTGVNGALKGRELAGKSKVTGSIQHMKCGVGLVLESWKPRGLALALNVLARTHEAVRVEQVRSVHACRDTASSFKLSAFRTKCACS